MLLAELHAEIAKDFPINKLDLGNEAIRSSMLWIKYIQYWSEEDLRLKKMESGRDKLVSAKREYYSGRASAAVYQANPWNGATPKTDKGVQTLIDADLEVIAYDEGVLVQRQKVMVIEAALDEQKRRGYAIRAAIDHLKFTNGA